MGDDLELGCGATLTKLIAPAAHVSAIDFSDGSLGADSGRDQSQETYEALSFLGIKGHRGGERDCANTVCGDRSHFSLPRSAVTLQNRPAHAAIRESRSHSRESVFSKETVKNKLAHDFRIKTAKHGGSQLEDSPKLKPD